MSGTERTGSGGAIGEARVGAVLVAVLDGAPGPEFTEFLRRAGTTRGVGSVAVLRLARPAESGAGAPDPHGAVAALTALDMPVVMAMAGPVTGDALALALAADVRLAEPGATFAFPQVRAGLVPAAGASQRLPRLIGAAEALRLMLTGAPVAAGEALALGLLDRVEAGDLAAAAVQAATALAGQRAGAGRGLRDPLAFQAAVGAARRALAAERLPAPERIVDCVEAALLLPLEQGLMFEAAAFEDLARTEEAAGLAHALAAEARLETAIAAGTGPLPGAVSVWGAGGGAVGLVRLALAAGLRVGLCDPDREALIRGLETVAAAQEEDVVAGRMSAEARDADWARLTPWLEPVAEGAVLLCPGSEPWAARAGRLAVPALVPGAEPAPGTVALFPALPGAALPRAGAVAELVAGAGVDALRLDRAAAAVTALGLRALPEGPEGPAVLRLRAALAAAIAHLEGRGMARARIAAALTARGLIGGQPAPRSLREEPEAAEAVARCEAAMINAAARLVAAGSPGSPLALDALAVAGGLYPRWLGGPLHRADRRGLLLVRRDLAGWAAEAPQIWQPAPLIEDLAARGGRFADLDLSPA